ncbi:MAG: formyltransferase family protein [bacterium]
MKAVVFAARSAGVCGLQALLDRGVEVLKVFAEAVPAGAEGFYDSPAEFCRERDIPFAFCSGEELPALISEVRDLSPEAGFAFDFYSVLQPELVSLSAQGFYFLHLSLLPACQGPWPVNRAILEGERKTGVTLGRVFGAPLQAREAARREVWISNHDTAPSLYHKLAREGAELLDRTLPSLKAGSLDWKPLEMKPGSHYRSPEEAARIDWLLRSFQVYNRVRALTRPFGGAYTVLDKETMIVWRAMPDDTNPGLLSAGELDADEGKLYVGTREGAVRLLEVEWKGELLEEPRIAEVVGPYWPQKFE